MFRTAHSVTHFNRHRMHRGGKQNLFSHICAATSQFLHFNEDRQNLCQLNCTSQDFCGCLDMYGPVGYMLLEPLSVTCWKSLSEAGVEAGPAVTENGRYQDGWWVQRWGRSCAASQPAWAERPRAHFPVLADLEPWAEVQSREVRRSLLPARPLGKATDLAVSSL